MKTCSQCKISKEEAEFYWASQGRLRSNCKVCHKAHMRPRSQAHYSKNKEYYTARNKAQRASLSEYIRTLKDFPCVDCNQKHPWWVMQFDHVKGSKKYNVSMMAKYGSRALVDAEVKKCEVVCANCHANRTYRRKHGGLQ